MSIRVGIPTAIGTLAAARTAIANSVTSAKHQAAEEAKTQRHNKEMEKMAQNVKAINIGSGLKKRPNPAVKQFRHYKMSKGS